MFIRFRNSSLGVAGLALAGVLAGAVPSAAVSPGLAGNLFVSADVSNQLGEYTGTRGTYQGVFTTPSASGGYMGIHFNAAGTRMLVGAGNGGVEEYDATTGAYIKTYNPGGGWQWGALYAPNGNVLITYSTGGTMLEVDSSWATVQTLKATVGYAEWRATLYGPPTRK
jgi:hypothetical protein